MQAVTEPENQEGPMLWTVEALTEPIAVRLRFHFASSSGSMNQPEHPEWLFQTALRYARGLAPALEGLQEIVTAHGLHETYHLPFELARALRSSVQVTPLAARCPVSSHAALACHPVRRFLVFLRALSALSAYASLHLSDATPCHHPIPWLAM